MNASWHRTKDGRGQVTHTLIDHEGTILGHATMCWRHGADDYPWDWWLANGVPVTFGRKAAGVTDTLRDAKEQVRLATSHQEAPE